MQLGGARARQIHEPGHRRHRDLSARGRRRRGPRRVHVRAGSRATESWPSSRSAPSARSTPRPVTSRSCCRTVAATKACPARTSSSSSSSMSADSDPAEGRRGVRRDPCSQVHGRAARVAAAGGSSGARVRACRMPISVLVLAMLAVPLSRSPRAKGVTRRSGSASRVHRVRERAVDRARLGRAWRYAGMARHLVGPCSRGGARFAAARPPIGRFRAQPHGGRRDARVTLLRGYIMMAVFRGVALALDRHRGDLRLDRPREPAPRHRHRQLRVPAALELRAAAAAAQDLRHAARGGADRLVAEPRQPRGAPRARS